MPASKQVQQASSMAVQHCTFRGTIINCMSSHALPSMHPKLGSEGICHTDRQTNKQASKQANKQKKKNRQTSKQKGSRQQPVKQSSIVKQTSKQPNKQTSASITNTHTRNMFQRSQCPATVRDASKKGGQRVQLDTLQTYMFKCMYTCT